MSDAAGLTQLWEEALPSVQAMVQHRLGTLAADALEDVLSKAHIDFRRSMREHAERNETVAVPGALAMTIAKRRVADERRQREARERLEQALRHEYASEDVAVDPDPFLGQVMERFQLLIRETFRDRPQCRPVIVARMQGLSWNDATELLGEPAPRLRKRFERCLEHLRSMIGGEDRLDFLAVLYE